MYRGKDWLTILGFWYHSHLLVAGGGRLTGRQLGNAVRRSAGTSTGRLQPIQILLRLRNTVPSEEEVGMRNTVILTVTIIVHKTDTFGCPLSSRLNWIVYGGRTTTFMTNSLRIWDILSTMQATALSIIIASCCYFQIFLRSAMCSKLCTSIYVYESLNAWLCMEAIKFSADLHKIVDSILAFPGAAVFCPVYPYFVLWATIS